MRATPERLALRVTLLYCIFAGAWIFFSDWLLELLVSDPHRIARFQTYKGFAFVFVTGGSLFLVVRAYLRRWQEEAEERRRVEAGFKESAERLNERFALITRATNDALWDWNVTTNELWWNEGYNALFGYEIEPIQQGISSWMDQLHPDDRERVTKSFHAIVESGNTWLEEYRFRRRDGSYANVLDRGFTIRDASGRAVRMIGAMMDITARKNAEEELRRREQQFRTLIENASDLINVLDPAGIIRYQSPSGERLLGYGATEMIGRSALQFVHPDDAPRVKTALQRAIASPATPIVVQFRFHHRDGSWRQFETTMRTIPGERNEWSVVVNSHDVTEGRRLEAQLRQAQKMEAVGQLSGGVAHDFNNILTIIQGHSAVLKEQPGITAEMRESTSEIERAAQRAANLTRQLLTFSRQQPLQSCDIDMNELVAATSKMLERLLGENIAIQVNYAPEAPVVHADPGMLDQILLNLAVNARDAMPHGGKLTIDISLSEIDPRRASELPNVTAGSFVRLTVSDTGCGIAADVVPRIFEPFFTTKEIGKGTGLGLATVYGIVQQHGGWIDVLSEVGRGSTFRVHFPRATGTSKSSSNGETKVHAPIGKETILFVEDEPALRTLVRKSLTRWGYRVFDAPSGVAACDIWAKHGAEVQLLLTDLIMPDGMNGFELAQRLLKDNPKLPVIYTSGYSHEVAGKEFALKPGVNFLPKPFDFRALARAVREGLDGRPQ